MGMESCRGSYEKLHKISLTYQYFNGQYQRTNSFQDSLYQRVTPTESCRFSGSRGGITSTVILSPRTPNFEKKRELLHSIQEDARRRHRRNYNNHQHERNAVAAHRAGVARDTLLNKRQRRHLAIYSGIPRIQQACS